MKRAKSQWTKAALPSAYNPTACVLKQSSQPYYKSLHSKFPTNYLSEDEAPPVVQVVERPRKSLRCCTRKILSTKLHHPTRLVMNHNLPQLVITTTRHLTRWMLPHPAEAQLRTTALRTEWHRSKPPKISMCCVEKRRNWRDIWKIVLLDISRWVSIYCCLLFICSVDVWGEVMFCVGEECLYSFQLSFAKKCIIICVWMNIYYEQLELRQTYCYLLNTFHESSGLFEGRGGGCSMALITNDATT